MAKMKNSSVKTTTIKKKTATIKTTIRQSAKEPNRQKDGRMDRQK